LACGLVTTVSWYQKTWFSVRSQINSHEVSSLILMCCNFDGWFALGLLAFSSVFLVMSCNLFYYQLWKVITFSMSIFGSSSRSKLPTWLTSALSCKTCSNCFWCFLSTLLAYYKQFEVFGNYWLFWFI
jgi:hypothetical protein